MSLEHTKPQATDDVWVSRFYAWRMYSFKEVIECHRETHHPTIYNAPDAPINLFIELDMKTAKPVSLNMSCQLSNLSMMSTYQIVIELRPMSHGTVQWICCWRLSHDDKTINLKNIIYRKQKIQHIWYTFRVHNSTELCCRNNLMGWKRHADLCEKSLRFRVCGVPCQRNIPNVLIWLRCGILMVNWVEELSIPGTVLHITQGSLTAGGEYHLEIIN